MGSSHFPEILCLICSRPVDLRTDLSADENGKAIHTGCYFKRIISANLLANSGAAQRQQLML